MLEPCQYFTDKKGASNEEFYYCITHQCRTSSQADCWKRLQETGGAVAKDRGPSPEKARTILRDGRVRGKALTAAQRRFMGARAKEHQAK